MRMKLANLLQKAAAWAGCSESVLQPAASRLQAAAAVPAIDHAVDRLPLLDSRLIWAGHTRHSSSAASGEVRPPEPCLTSRWDVVMEAGHVLGSALLPTPQKEEYSGLWVITQWLTRCYCRFGEPLRLVWAVCACMPAYPMFLRSWMLALPCLQQSDWFSFDPATCHTWASQGGQECPLCQRVFQQRHFRLLQSGGEGREHICRGCSQKHKMCKTLVGEGMTGQQ